MRLRNIRISRLLSLGMGIIIAFIIVLGLDVFLSVMSLDQNMKDIYNHPLIVRRAIGDLNYDILSINIETKEMILENNRQNIETYVNQISDLQSNADLQINTIRSQYLGPTSNVEDLEKSIKLWATIRNETIRLIQNGNIDNATSRLKEKGIEENQVQNIIKRIKVISDFAKSKGDQIYLDSQIQYNAVVLQLLIAIIIIVLLSLGINFEFRRLAIHPLRELTLTAEALGSKDFKARSSFKSKNELGVLSKSLNSMAAVIEKEIDDKDNVAKLSVAFLSNDALRPFCHELLKALLNYTYSQVGAIYLINVQKSHYEHFESVGLSKSLHKSFSISKHEGEFGAVISSSEIHHLKDIPSDVHYTFVTVSGDFKPKEIITIPIINGGNVVAVISLASISKYSESSITLINNIWSELTARFISSLNYEKTLEFSKELLSLNSELEAQAEELSIQTDELMEQNIELGMQKKQLDEANQLKSTFLSNMSHELRTPLNSIIALSSVLNRHLQGAVSGDDYSYVDIIERNGKNLLSLVNDILDISRIEAGKEEITRNQFSIDDLINEIVETFETQATEENIELIYKSDKSIGIINSDLDKCRHILQNLIGNAIKFTKEGKVKISVSHIDDEIHIIISDTGIGIAEDKLSLIFDEFRQEEEGTSRKYGGSGLGLSIAKKYANLLNGDIIVTSVKGKGSSFELVLPLVIENYSEIDTNEPTRINGFSETSFMNNEKIEILLVEDSEPAIIQIEDILTEQHYQVSIARSGREALDYVDKSMPNAIILDLMMPGIDGFEVLKNIRDIDKLKNIPVMILTAKNISKDELNFLKSNHIFQLIQKGSVSKNELLQHVKNMLQSVKRLEYTEENVFNKEKNNAMPLVLLVEDIPDNMTTLKALLKDKYDLLEATDGKAAIDIAKRNNPSLIILDISLPIMDGFEVIKELKSDKTLCHIPVIAMTARAMKGDKEEILAHGFDSYISKPIDELTLNNILKEMLAGGRLDGE